MFPLPLLHQYVLAGDLHLKIRQPVLLIGKITKTSKEQKLVHTRTLDDKIVFLKMDQPVRKYFVLTGKDHKL